MTTLKELYLEAKKAPTPAQLFIRKIAEATCREEATIRMWMSGIQQPSLRAKKQISRLLGRPVEELFPNDSE